MWQMADVQHQVVLPAPLFAQPIPVRQQSNDRCEQRDYEQTNTTGEEVDVSVVSILRVEAEELSEPTLINQVGEEAGVHPLRRSQVNQMQQ